MMSETKIMSKATLSENEHYQVVYNQNIDVVILEIGGTSLTLNVSNFMMMNEMVRKAAARLVMQTKIS